VFHLLRNLGSSFFISLSIAEIVRATAANYSRMSEMISPYNTTLALPWAAGGWDLASVPGLAAIAKEITCQAAMIGYLNGFMMYTVACTPWHVHRGLGPRPPVRSRRARRRRSAVARG
jgi:DHA2 family multidrug resistance protein